MARKLFIVTRMLSVSSSSVPLTNIFPILASHAGGRILLVREGLRDLQEARARLPGAALELLLEQTVRIEAPVMVLVTRLLPKGCTVKASP